MATSFCDINHGSGLKILHDYCLNQSYAERSCPVALYQNASKRLSQFCYSTRKDLNWTTGRLVEIKKLRQHERVLSKIRTDSMDYAHEGENEMDVSKSTLIWRAIKLPIYSVALVPLTVGSAAAYLHTGLFSARRYLVLLASSVLIITWLNLRS